MTCPTRRGGTFTVMATKAPRRRDAAAVMARSAAPITRPYATQRPLWSLILVERSSERTYASGHKRGGARPA
jgi:hypothetical protein